MKSKLFEQKSDLITFSADLAFNVKCFFFFPKTVHNLTFHLDVGQMPVKNDSDTFESNGLQLHLDEQT